MAADAPRARSRATVALAVAGSAALRRERRLTGEVAELAERIRELSARVEAAEADVAHAVTQAEITETLLVEKGVADEEDIEAVRRRFDGDESDRPPARPLPARAGTAASH